MTYRYLSEAINYALSRNVVLPNDYYQKFTALQRAQSVSISGLTELSQIEHVMNQVNKSLINGSTFKDFQDAVKSGDIAINLPDHRLDNIFRTNLQVAYNRGRWDQQQRVKSSRPYLMYSAINDSRTRPAHRALNGTIRPIDDVFWSNHYAPLGYRCRCTTISLTEEQAAARGGVTEPPDVSADSGWGYNVGTNYSAGIEQALERIQVNNPALPQMSDAAKAIQELSKNISTFDPSDVIDSWIGSEDKKRYLKFFSRDLEALTFANQHGLSLPEMLAIRHYTSAGSRDLNKFLNGDSDFDFEYENTLIDASVLLDAALDKLPDYLGVVVRRLSLPDDVLEQHSIGTVVTYNAFTSSTYGIKDISKHSPIRLILTSKTGKKINLLSVFGDSSITPEYEVLFSRPKRFEVISRIDKMETEGYIEIRLKELDE